MIADQAISGGGELCDLTIDKASGTVSLSDNLIVNGDFTHLSGQFDANGQSVEFEGYNTTIDADSIVFGDVILNTSGTTTVDVDMYIDGNLKGPFGERRKVSYTCGTSTPWRLSI